MMRKMLLFIGLLVLAAQLLAACSSSPSNDTNDNKPVNIKIESTPVPVITGDVEFVLTLTDQQGNPIEDASVDISVDHTDMSGMELSGAATDQGDGKYAINTNFSMSGNWKMTVYVRKDSLDYKEEIDLLIK